MIALQAWAVRGTAFSRSAVVVLALLVGLMGGCTTVAPRQTTPLPDNLAELEYWQARGRIGLTGAAGGGSGSFDWQQSNDRAEVQLRGPVGIGSLHMKVTGSAAAPELELETGDGKLESQAAWDALEARLGAILPAGNLRFWMLGIAAPGEHRWLEPGADGVVTLEQSGWRIDYQRYSDDSGAHVPVRINASSGATRVRIVVDRWQLGRS